MNRLSRSAAAFTLGLASALALAACASDPAADAPATLTSVATASAGALTVELLTDTRLETGMTPIHVKLSAGGQPVTDADVTFEPMMAMSGGMNHACPVGKPELGSDGVYHGYANFIMGSSMMGSWSATVGVTRPGAARVDASFPGLVVTDGGRAKNFQFFDPDTATTTRYFASLRFTAAPKVGQNPVKVTLHRMAGMMSFPAVDDATIHLDPQMPSMGHGGAGTVDPSAVTSGVYQGGNLGFTMTGEWETTVTIRRPASAGGTQIIGAPVFKTVF